MSDPISKFVFSDSSPDLQGDFHSQLKNIWNKIAALNDNQQIIRLVFFIDCSDNISYNDKRSMILEMSDRVNQNFSTISVIAQKPLVDSLIAAELTFINNSNDNQCEYYSNGIISVSEVQKNGIFQYHGTVNASVDGNIFDKSESCFAEIEKYLKAKNLDFSDIVRQWNYIEKITGSSKIQNRDNQHYDIFNIVRSQYYQKCDFQNGYPAATGIGTDSGGITIDFIAWQKASELKTYSLQNPIQTESYDYSHEVLICNTTEESNTPKFERGKIVKCLGDLTVFISGTAAIVGENSIENDNLKAQTFQTFENIFHLIKYDNLPDDLKPIEKLKILEHQDSELLYQALIDEAFQARIYIKKKSVSEFSHDFIQNFLNQTNYLPLEADICREELLVEIEGCLTF